MTIQDFLHCRDQLLEDMRELERKRDTGIKRKERRQRNYEGERDLQSAKILLLPSKCEIIFVTL